MKEKLRNSIFCLTLILMAGLFLGESKVYAVEVGSDTDAYDGEWGYRFLDDGTVSISEYLGEGGNITIPTELGGYPVSEIGRYPRSNASALYDKLDTLTEITIPGSVKKIDYAFGGSSNLKKVTIEDGVESINSAFQSCDSLESVEVPGSIVSMSGAFSSCDKLKTVIIDSGVETVAGFSGCDNLTDVVIPYGVKEIAGGAFSYCENLTNITLPGEVEINRTSFDGTFNIQTITIAEGSEKVSYNLNYIFDQAVSSANGTRKSLKTLNIPDSVTTMEDDIFERCTALTTINLSNNLTNLGKRQFYRCTSLTHITLPDSLITIDESAFSSCSLLAEINIPDSVIRIEDSAFASCYKLSNVTFGENLQSIGETAFFLTDLVNVTFGNNLQSIGSRAFDMTSSTMRSATIPKSVTSIGEDAFESSEDLTIYGYTGSAAQVYAQENNIRFVALDGGQGTQSGSSTQKTPGGGTGNSGSSYTGDVRRTVGSGASRATYTTTGPDTAEYSFPAVASGVTEIVIPDTVIINGRSYKVTYVGSNAFAGNTTITKVSIGKNVQTIRSGAFAGCTNLKKITGGKSLTYIYERAFENCAKLKKVNLTSKSLISIGDYAFRKCTSLKSLTVKSKKLTSIGKQAFAGDKKLKKVTLSTTKLKKSSVKAKAFKGIAKKCVFKAPAKKAAAYKNIFKARGAKKAVVK